MVQGSIYASISLPMIIGVTYFFIYWAVPYLLFKEKYILFALTTVTIFLGILDVQIVFALSQRVFLAEDILSEAVFVHWDAFYMMIATLVISLPAIAYETLRNWIKKQKEVIKLHQNDREQYIEVKSAGKTYRIASSNIHFIESYGDYAHIHLADKKVVTRMTLKKLDEIFCTSSSILYC